MENENEIEIDLVQIFRLLKRRAIIIIVVTLLGGIIAYTLSSFLTTPQYESNVNIIVNTKSDESGNMTNDNIISSQNMISTYAVIIKSNTVLNKVIDRLDLDLSYEALAEKIEVSAVSGTQVMKIAVKDANPTTATKILKEVTKLAPDAIIDAVDAGSCKVISEITEPNHPLPRQLEKKALTGAAAAFVVCVAIIIVLELLHNYIEDDDDVQKKLDLPVLGVIPDIDGV